MDLKGTVKLEVEIAPNGKVSSVKPLGGHPLLVDCAGQSGEELAARHSRANHNRTGHHHLSLSCFGRALIGDGPPVVITFQ